MGMMKDTDGRAIFYEVVSSFRRDNIINKYHNLTLVELELLIR